MFLLGTTLAWAQKHKEAALDHYNNQRWEEAISSYQKYLKKNDGDSSDWYNLAVSQSKMMKYEEAIPNYRKALEKNFNAQFIYWNISKSYGIMGDENKMFKTLNEGANNGLATFALLQSDTTFALYADKQEFKDVLKKVELNAYPCLSGKNYRHFDFWIGEWDVMVNGNKVGDNSITMAKGGCAIHENYTTTRNYAGQSINFYDPIDKKWHQHWVGSSGDTYNYLETKREEGLLQFESKFMNGSGQISLSRLTFTLNEDGTARQLFESSTDDGKTWTPAFDGLYKRKK